MGMTDVLIVGAGPTGLVLACDLARRGAAVRVVDRSPAPPRTTRGPGAHPPGRGVRRPGGGGGGVGGRRGGAP
ncbi:FAD-dependent oxidoreductase, partial [Streptomyces anulatus]